MALKNLLYEKLIAKLPDIHLNGHLEKRLPNTLNISFPGIEASTLLSSMNEIAASAGAACHSHGINISSVLKAINLPEKLAKGTIRFSTGKFLTKDDIEKASEIVIKSYKSAIEK
jgi:cysteine desulfurase